jgi:hypothetical protein
MGFVVCRAWSDRKRCIESDGAGMLYFRLFGSKAMLFHEAPYLNLSISLRIETIATANV